MFTAIFDFFAFGTIAFWVLLFVCSITTVASLEKASHIPSTIVTLLLIGLTFHSWPSMHWWMYLVLALGYFVIGGFWSIFRWLQFVRTTVEQGLHCSRDQLEAHLRPSEHKQTIYGWIAFWPWSLVWHAIGDIVKETFRKLVNCYNNITKRALDKHFAHPTVAARPVMEERFERPRRV